MSHPRPSLFERHALGELDADERLALEAHAASCPECAARLAEERALDDAIVRTAGETLPADTSRRMFDELWARVDGDEPLVLPVPARTPWRRAAGWVALVAAAALVIWLAAGFERDGATPSEPAPVADVVSPTIAPTSEPSAPVTLAPTPTAEAPADLAALAWEAQLAEALARSGVTTVPDDETTRRAAAAGALARGFVDAAREHPLDDAAFLAVCVTLCDARRAEGLVVDPLVRRLVDGDDVTAARAAVRFAALGGASDIVLVRALDDDRFAAEVVAALARRGLAEPPSARLVRALVARLDDDLTDGVAALRAIGAEQAVADELARRAVQAERRRSSDAARDVLALGRVAPPHAAVGAWLDLAARGDVETAWRELVVTVERDGEEALDALAAALDDPRHSDQAGAWALRLARPAPAGRLAAWAVTRGDDEALAAALALADARALPDLFDVWRDQRDRRSGESLATAVTRLLTDAAAVARLIDAVPRDGLDDLVVFATEVTTSPRVAGDLLVALAVEKPDAARRPLVLGHLARLGGPEHAAALLDAARVDDDPLTWLTAAVLDAATTDAAFTAAGGAPGALVALLDDAPAWPHHVHLPPSRVVRRAADLLDDLNRPSSTTLGDDR